jgi:hypothetical protein
MCWLVEGALAAMKLRSKGVDVSFLLRDWVGSSSHPSAGTNRDNVKGGSWLLEPVNKAAAKLS